MSDDSYGFYHADGTPLNAERVTYDRWPIIENWIANGEAVPPLELVKALRDNGPPPAFAQDFIASLLGVESVTSEPPEHLEKALSVLLPPQGPGRPKLSILDRVLRAQAVVKTTNADRQRAEIKAMTLEDYLQAHDSFRAKRDDRKEAGDSYGTAETDIAAVAERLDMEEKTVAKIVNATTKSEIETWRLILWAEQGGSGEAWETDFEKPISGGEK